eukprot:92480-Prymnesium_polylepis.1
MRQGAPSHPSHNSAPPTLSNRTHQKVKASPLGIEKPCTTARRKSKTDFEGGYRVEPGGKPGPPYIADFSHKTIRAEPDRFEDAYSRAHDE